MAVPVDVTGILMVYTFTASTPLSGTSFLREVFPLLLLLLIDEVSFSSITST